MPGYYNNYGGYGFNQEEDYEDQYPWRDTVSEIYSLRREGDLDEALELARTAHNEYPDQDDVSKAYGWTLCSLCKQAIANGQMDIAKALYENEYCKLKFYHPDEFLDTLRKSFLHIAKQLNPFNAQIEAAIEESKGGNTKSAAEKMLALLDQHALKQMHVEDLGWVLFRYVNSYEGDGENTDFLIRCINVYHKICGNKKSLLHSSFLSAIVKLCTKQRMTFDSYFFNAWGPANLRDEDYQNNMYDGKSYPSLFYRVCNCFLENNLPFDLDLFCEKTGKKPSYVIDTFRKCWFWKIYRESQNGKGESLWSLFDEYNERHSQLGPSEWHSQIMKLALRCMVEQDTNRLLPFFVHWGHNFSAADWEPSIGKDGEEYPPLAVKAIKSSFESLNESSQDNPDHIHFLIAAYEEAVEMIPDDEWIRRNLGRLYYRKGDFLKAEAIYCDLSKILFDKYYYWQEFAQIISDPNVKAGMLAKALILESNEDYIGDIRLEMASVLISIENSVAASRELELYHANRVKNGWKISDTYTKMRTTLGAPAEENANKGDFYQTLAIAADEYVYKDYPWIDVVIAETWEAEGNKTFIMLTDGQGHNFKCKQKSYKLLQHSHLGQSFQLKYEEENSKILLLRSSSLEDWAPIPEKYAYVEYINEEKSVAHIITQDNKALYFHFIKDESLTKGSFLKIRSYDKVGKEKGMITNIVCKNKCTREEALPAFKSKVVVVDDVNESKDLFHFILGCGLIGGVIKYNETSLRPNIGDYVKVHYCIAKDKVGKKKAIAIDVEATDEIAPGMVFTTIGYVEVQYKNGHQFGFINGYYVPERLTYCSCCGEKVMAKVLNIEKDGERVFDLKPYAENQ